MAAGDEYVRGRKTCFTIPWSLYVNLKTVENHWIFVGDGQITVSKPLKFSHEYKTSWFERGFNMCKFLMSTEETCSYNLATTFYFTDCWAHLLNSTQKLYIDTELTTIKVHKVALVPTEKHHWYFIRKTKSYCKKKWSKSPEHQTSPYKLHFFIFCFAVNPSFLLCFSCTVGAPVEHYMLGSV